MEKKLLIGSLIAAMLITVGYIVFQYTETMHGFELSDLGNYFRPEVYNKRLAYSKASGSQVCLVNYKNATDPTWDELIAFLRSEGTDEQPYKEGSFVCADFAEMLHNNAEASGIKAAFVCVDFVNGGGHALNAFNATDRGLVYVDCTGEGFQNPVSPSQVFKDTNHTRKCPHFDYTCDKIAYVVEGKEYGMITIDKASSLDYRFYENYTAKWEEYERQLEAYNSDVKEFNNTLETTQDSLNAMQDVLGYYRWKSLGIVTNVDICW